MKFEIKKVNLRLKMPFKSRKSTISEKEIGYIFLFDSTESNLFGIGEIIPNHTLNENLNNCIDTILKFDLKTEYKSFFSLEKDLRKAFNHNTSRSVFHGIESAIIDYKSKLIKQPIYEYLNTPNPNGLETCLTIPIQFTKDDIKSYVSSTNSKILKFKLTGVLSVDIERINMAIEISKEKVWIDAEGMFSTFADAKNFIDTIGSRNILLLEDPFCFEPNTQWALLKSICPVYVDRYFTNSSKVYEYSNYVTGFNVKTSRLGGLINCRDIILEITRLKNKVILGSVLETTVNIANSFSLAGLVNFLDLDGFTFFENTPFHGITIKGNKISYIKNIGNGIL